MWPLRREQLVLLRNVYKESICTLHHIAYTVYSIWFSVECTDETMCVLSLMACPSRKAVEDQLFRRVRKKKVVAIIFRERESVLSMCPNVAVGEF